MPRTPLIFGEPRDRMPLRRYSPFSRTFHQELAVTDSIEHDVSLAEQTIGVPPKVVACVPGRQDVAAGIRRHDSHRSACRRQDPLP